VTANHHHQSGLTMIELIITIVIISIALAGLLSVINLTVSHSADPVIEHQAIAIAEAYLEEIQLQAYADPGAGACANRACFDDVADYNGLNDVGARDPLGNLIPNLAAYTVSVAVAAPQAEAGLNAIAITVTVTGPGAQVVSLVGYKFENSL
jgi:MSHA pilin protein MshD